uniref:Glycoprotein 4 n=1 Tax=Equine arteritis virus TaxID=11047 RepID=A0A481WVN2_EAV|nr:glycoprotein 4 [Equine arteritis virus]
MKNYGYILGLLLFVGLPCCWCIFYPCHAAEARNFTYISHGLGRVHGHQGCRNFINVTHSAFLFLNPTTLVAPAITHCLLLVLAARMEYPNATIWLQLQPFGYHVAGDVTVNLEASKRNPHFKLLRAPALPLGFVAIVYVLLRLVRWAQQCHF